MAHDTGSDDGAGGYDFGPFAIVPAWLLQRVTGHVALRVYIALGTFAGNGRECWPSRATLAARAGIDEAGVKRALRQLDEAGAIRRVARFHGDGAQRSNGYVLVTHDPNDPESFTPQGANESPPPPGHSVAPRPKETITKEHARPTDVREGANDSSSAVIVSRRGWKVDRRVVTDAEDEDARAILHDWNVMTGQALTAQGWLAKIVMRMREHPELAVDDHHRIIEASLADPWWRGAPTPSVVYGSDAQFERCIATAQQGSSRGGQAAFDVARAALHDEEDE